MKHPFYPSSFVFTELQRVALLTGVLSFLAGTLVGWGIALRANRTDIVSNEDVLTPTTTSLGSVSRGVFAGENESIAVTDQKAGNTVFVASVALSQPGWVAVREEVNGEPGKVLGAQWFAAGSSTGSVSLLRGTRLGGRYHAYLLHDDGDMKLDLAKDLPITEDGLLILRPFTTY